MIETLCHFGKFVEMSSWDRCTIPGNGHAQKIRSYFGSASMRGNLRCVTSHTTWRALPKSRVVAASEFLRR
jgi:hypothetical protein